MPTLERTLYVSRSAAALTVERLRVLIGEAQVRNRQHDLTGALLHADGRFLQVLEGRPAALDRLLARIARDDRHHDMHVLWRDAVDVRRFDRWSMALAYDVGPVQALGALEGLPALPRGQADALIERCFGAQLPFER